MEATNSIDNKTNNHSNPDNDSMTQRNILLMHNVNTARDDTTQRTNAGNSKHTTYSPWKLHLLQNNQSYWNGPNLTNNQVTL